jgi:hypothetical protein
MRTAEVDCSQSDGVAIGQSLNAVQVFCILMMFLAGILFGGIIGEMQARLLHSSAGVEYLRY